MKKVTLYLLGLAVSLFCLLAFPAWAEDASTESGAYKLDEIVVTATKTEKKIQDVPAAVEVINADDIKRKNAFWADDLMSDLPGVYLKRSNFADFTASSAMSIRGVGGGGRTLILFNGVPLNEPYWGSGHVEFSAISMDDVKKIEVVKGPFSSLYGGNAMAGVINVISNKPVRDEVVMKTSYGSLNTIHNFFKISKLINDKWGIAATYDKIASDGQQNSYITNSTIGEVTDVTGMTQVSGVQISKTKYGATQYFVGDPGNQTWDQDKIGVTVSFTPAPDHSLFFEAVYSDRLLDHENPRNYLRDESGNIFDEGDFYFEQNGLLYAGTAKPTDFLYRMRVTPRIEKNILSSLTYQGRIGETNVSSILGYVTHDLERIKSRKTGATSFGGPGGSNEVFDYSLYWDTNGSRQINRHLLTLGASVRYNDAQEKIHNVSDWRDFDSVTVTTSDVTGDNYLYSLYAQDDISITPKFNIIAGLRYDLWANNGGRSIGRTGDGSLEETIDFDSSSEGQFSPKIAFLSHLTDNLALRGSWGMAFRPPSLSELYRTTINFGTRYTYSNPDLKPETINSFDLGITQNLFGGKTAVTAGIFYNEIDDMVTTAMMDYTINGMAVVKYINSGKSISKGIELAVSHQILPWLRASGNYTYTDSETKENDISPASEGKQLLMVPENMFNVSLNADFQNLWARLSYEYADKVYADGDLVNDQTVWGVYGSYDEIKLMNFKVGYQINDHAEISYGCQNLLDRKYFRGRGTGIADGRRHLAQATLRF